MRMCAVELVGRIWFSLDNARNHGTRNESFNLASARCRPTPKVTARQFRVRSDFCRSYVTRSRFPAPPACAYGYVLG